MGTITGKIVHLIHIPLREDQVRAVGALLPIPVAWVKLPGDLYCITEDHLKALELANPKISFHHHAPQNGQTVPS